MNLSVSEDVHRLYIRQTPISLGVWPGISNGRNIEEDDFRMSEEREDACQEHKRDDIPAFFK